MAQDQPDFDELTHERFIIFYSMFPKRVQSLHMILQQRRRGGKAQLGASSLGSLVLENLPQNNVLSCITFLWRLSQITTNVVA